VRVNSLVGKQDVFGRYRSRHGGAVPLSFKLLERHTFPLLFCSGTWHRMRVDLLQEFSRWRNQNRAAYAMDARGNLYWSYELIECRVGKGTKS
jgi:release factor glutamine methyltransferase